MRRLMRSLLMGGRMILVIYTAKPTSHLAGRWRNPVFVPPQAYTPAPAICRPVPNSRDEEQMKKARNAIVLGAVLLATALPTAASAHVVRVAQTGDVHPLHSGPVTPPAHTGGLLTASEAVDGVRDTSLNVGNDN